MTDTSLCIKPIDSFVETMLAKLALNSEKKPWSERTIEWLLIRLEDELEELKDAINEETSPEFIMNECADVGNFAMMIHDIVSKRIQTNDGHSPETS